MTVIKKCGGFTSSSFTDLIFAYYTWCKVAANASARSDLNLPPGRGLGSGAGVEYGKYNHPDFTIPTSNESDSLRSLALEHSKSD
jgi:hypothetical protein